MNETISTNQNTEQRPTTPTPEASGDQGERLFSQEDVNRIVGERLARAKRETATDEREADLRARENRLSCREFLADKRYPADLLDILDTTDLERFKGNVERLAGLFQSVEPTGSTVRVDLAAPLGGNPRSGPTVADAFKPPKI